MGAAADLISVEPAFLRALGHEGLLTPRRSAGGHRRYSRADLDLAARARAIVDEGLTVAAACRIALLEHQLAECRFSSLLSAGDAASWPFMCFSSNCPDTGSHRSVISRAGRALRQASTRTVGGRQNLPSGGRRRLPAHGHVVTLRPPRLESDVG